MKRNEWEYTAKQLMEVALLQIERMAGLERKENSQKPEKREAAHVCREQQQRP